MKFGTVLKSLNFYTIRKGLAYLRQYGLKEFKVRLSERMEETADDYASWCRHDALTAAQRRSQRAKEWEHPPLLSVVVPLYCTPQNYLREMLLSVREQTYPFWELCLADGSPDETVGDAVRTFLQETQEDRIHYRHLEKNGGLAYNTNEAISMASGEYLVFLDHDDVLAENALYEAACTAISKDADVIYSDEDKLRGDTNERFQPHFKPDFNLDLLRSNNYIGHLLVVRTALAKAAGLLDASYDGAQDHEFLFRLAERTKKIAHIPKILYHWRVHSSSTADNPLSKRYAYEAGKRAVREHLLRCAEEGEVSDTKFPGFYRVKYALKGEPLISILIPNKDQKATLQECLELIREKSTYKNYEILIVENNSTDPEIFDYYKKIEGKNGVHVVYWDGPFNYSAINNFGFTFARGDYLICLNNDITVITQDWMERLLGQCQREQVGIVGARLYYPDNTIQHAGVIVGIGGVAGALFVGMKRERSGYMRKAILQQDLSAVTAACMMVKRRAWEEAKGFDEALAVAFNDVDFCLRVRACGYLVVYEPNAELYHYESKSRGYEDTPQKQERFRREILFMQQRWSGILKEGDPYYNPNFSLSACDYSLKKN